jgi:hypothetical protein
MVLGQLAIYTQKNEIGPYIDCKSKSIKKELKT